MGKILPLVVLTFGLGAIFLAGKCFFGGCKHGGVNFKDYQADGWFGVKPLKAGEAIPKDSTEIRPFKISIPDAELNELKRRLNTSRYIDHVYDTQFTYGFNSNYLKQIVEYWQTTYNWRKEEAKLNSLPQFKTQIEGLDVHFVQVKPTKPAKTIIPLLVVHGWPGSFLEYYKAIPLLIEPNEDGVAFEVVAPSIPGYGYSEAPHQKGFNGAAAARVFTKLMKRLGHDKFVAHGGDWGSLIVRIISVVFPENTLGIHAIGNFLSRPVSLCHAGKIALASFAPSLLFGSEAAEHEYSKAFPFVDKFLFLLMETGYMHIQATKPDTVASALIDSPVGLAAYILEKFSTWTNPSFRNFDDGKLTEKFTLDELLTNIMIYWTSGNIASSQRFYKENFIKFSDWTSMIIPVPAATIDTTYELSRVPRALVEPYFSKLLQYTEITAGHFTAFEEPQQISNDIKLFVGKLLQHLRKEEKSSSSSGSKVSHDEH